jgi:hypothetical protein
MVPTYSMMPANRMTVMDTVRMVPMISETPLWDIRSRLGHDLLRW